MSIHDQFSTQILSHPEWEKIRSELCTPASEDDITKIELGGGLSVWYGECDSTPEQRKNDELFMELCWYVNHGPGYCAKAPSEIRKLLWRLDFRV